jgi:predicted phosphodiesterase
MKRSLAFLAVTILALSSRCQAASAVPVRLSHACLAVAGLPSAPQEPLPVWRFWSPVLGRHFYTLNDAEKQLLLSEYAHVWTYEGVAFRAFASNDDPNLAPVYRFWSGLLSAHFYTLYEGEKDWLITNYPDVWTYEGVAFYAYPPGRQPMGTMPVCRFWSGSLGSHFYTTNDAERFKLLSGYRSVWQYEGVAWYAYPPDTAAPAAIIKEPYLQQITGDSATIMWETDVASDSRVDYGRASTSESGTSDPAIVTLHRVALSGLNADTVYLYRASSRGAASPLGSFTTAPSAWQPFRFAVYGDSRGDPAMHARVVWSIISGGPAIVFHTGDLVDSGSDYSLWQTQFFQPAQELMANVPVVPVLGNHEYAGTGPLWFLYFFDRPLDEGWWALTYGNTRVIGLDTNVAYTAGTPQHTWLMQEFASAEYAGATWHIVLFHHPAFTCTTAHSDDMAVREHLVPLFEQYGVDVVFQGHSHTYERYRNNGIYYIVTAGGGAPLYPVAPDVIPPIRQFGLSVHHHCTVDVDPGGGSLTIRAVAVSGRIFDAVSLTKPPRSK